MAAHQKISVKKLDWESKGLDKVAAHAEKEPKGSNPAVGNLLKQATDEVPAVAARVPNEGKESLGLLKQATSEVPPIAKSAAK